MPGINIGALVIVGLMVLVLVIFTIARNRKDRKKLLPPETTEDPVEETRSDQEREKDKL